MVFLREISDVLDSYHKRYAHYTERNDKDFCEKLINLPLPEIVNLTFSNFYFFVTDNFEMIYKR